MSGLMIIGAGLAGCEAAWQLAERGFDVTLVEMKPARLSPAHSSANFAELVCSNSLRSDQATNAVGLLKQEMRHMDSLIMRCADETRIPAGAALAVDREGFSRRVTEAIRGHERIAVIEREQAELPEAPAIVATGPLTEGALFADIEKKLGQTLHFADAAAPILSVDSLNHDIVYRMSRYEKGEGGDYFNCPMDKAQYLTFREALLSAEKAPLHGFEQDFTVFEGCLPIETMASRGLDTMRFGPMKPVGLPDPRDGREPYAVVQLRMDDAAASMVNMVGFQTRLRFPEQKRVFGLIPGLEEAEFLRYGVMHRNSFLQSPDLLAADYSLRSNPLLFFAGQITGVEGYVESASSGLIAGISMARKLRGEEAFLLPDITALGALARYVSTPNRDFQPMNVNFGLFAPLEKRVRGKRARGEAMAERALTFVSELR